MNFSFLRNFQGAVNSLVKKVVEPKTFQVGYREIHQLCSQPMLTSKCSPNILKPTGFLIPALLQFTQVCGMKQKGVLQLRCKGCYKVQRRGRMYVMCRLHPRHKQQQMQKSFLKRAILTFAYQKKIRDW